MKDINKYIGKKQIILNMAANIISFSANIIVSFILTPFLINTLGKETYSFYPIANTLVSYMSVLTNAMNSMASRFVTISLVNGDDAEANRYYSSALASNILMSTILCIPMAMTVLFIDKFMEVPINSIAAIKALFALIFSSTLINIIASIFGIATFAKNRIDLRSLSELITAVMKLMLFYILYNFLTPSIVYVGVVTLVVASVNILFQFQYTKRLLPEIKIQKSNISWKHTKELLGSSSWNAINSFGNTLLAGMSMILANILYGAEASGSYSIVNTVPQFISGVIVMLVGVFYPVITYKYAQNDRDGLIMEIKNAQSMVGIFGCAVISVFSVMASDFFSLWTPNENSAYLSMLSFLTILPHFLIACIWPLTNLNVVMNKVRTPAVFTLLSGIANIAIAYGVYKLFNPGVLSLPLISSMLQVMWIGIFMPLYACKNLEIKWYTFYPPVLKALSCSVVVMVGAGLIKRIFVLDSWTSFILFGAVTGIISLALFALTMFGTKALRNVVEKVLKQTVG